MKKINLFLLGMSMLTTVIFVSCKKEGENTASVSAQSDVSTASMIAEDGNNPDEMMMTASADGKTALTATNSVNEGRNRRGHFLYTESNEAGTNQIFVYEIN